MNHKLVIVILIIAFAFFLFPQQEVVEESIDDSIVIGVKVHILKDSSGLYSTQRDEANIRTLFSEANRIWSPSKISFVVKETVVTKVTRGEIEGVVLRESGELFSHENFDENLINAVFVRSLAGVNGFVLPRFNTFFVADHTTVNDFRTTAHELGHLLALPHVPPANMLMAMGKNGEVISVSETAIARENALKL